MIWNKHFNLKNTHAIFGASQSAWLRYDKNKIVESLYSKYRKDLGTEIHEFACSQIILFHKFISVKNLKENLETYIYKKYFNTDTNEVSAFGLKMIKYLRFLPKESFESIKEYINDSIGFRMTTEQPLYFSEFFYGTADSISFHDNFLRIHDLKTGSKNVHIEQLLIYAALFCLEYKVKPEEIEIELRIYQNNEILYHVPEPEEIMVIMDKIIFNDNILQQMEKEN